MKTKINYRAGLIFFSLIILSMSYLVECESQYNRMRRDGLWWRDITPSMRKEIVLGYYSGAIAGFDLVREGLKKNDPCQTSLTYGAEKLQKNLLNINPDYIVFKVDSIYNADTLNLGLMVFHTIWISANDLTIKDRRKLKMLIEQYKREDCSKFKSQKELREYRNPY